MPCMGPIENKSIPREIRIKLESYLKNSEDIKDFSVMRVIEHLEGGLNFFKGISSREDRYRATAAVGLVYGKELKEINWNKFERDLSEILSACDFLDF